MKSDALDLCSTSCVACNCQAFSAHPGQHCTGAMGQVSEANRTSGRAVLDWLKRQCSAALSAFPLPLLPLFLAGGSLASLLYWLLLLLLLWLLCLRGCLAGSGSLNCVHFHRSSCLVCSKAIRSALALRCEAGLPQCCQIDAS